MDATAIAPITLHGHLASIKTDTELVTIDGLGALTFEIEVKGYGFDLTVALPASRVDEWRPGQGMTVTLSPT